MKQLSFKIPNLQWTPLSPVHHTNETVSLSWSYQNRILGVDKGFVIFVRRWPVSLRASRSQIDTKGSFTHTSSPSEKKNRLKSLKSQLSILAFIFCWLFYFQVFCLFNFFLQRIVQRKLSTIFHYKNIWHNQNLIEKSCLIYLLMKHLSSALKATICCKIYFLDLHEI